MGGVTANLSISKTVYVFNATSETIMQNEGMLMPLEQTMLLTYKLSGSDDGLMLNMGGLMGAHQRQMYSICNITKPNDTMPTQNQQLSQLIREILFDTLDNLELSESLGYAISYIWNDEVNIMGGKIFGQLAQTANFWRYSFDLSSIDFDLNQNEYFPSINESYLHTQIVNIQLYVSQTTMPTVQGNGLAVFNWTGFICIGQCYVTIDSELYIFAPSWDASDKLLIYDMANNVFREDDNYDASGKYAVSGACVAGNTITNSLYITGGFDNTNTYRNVTQIYYLNLSYCMEDTGMNVARAIHGCSFNKNQTQLYAIAGDNGMPYYGSIEKYNLDTNEWSVISATVQDGISHLRCILDDIQTG